MNQKIVDTFTVLNIKGLHLRPAAQLIKCIVGFQNEVEVTLACGGKLANGKSILDILLLEAGRGDIVTVEASGRDAERVVRSIIQLAQSQFHIQYP